MDFRALSRSDGAISVPGDWLCFARPGSPLVAEPILQIGFVWRGRAGQIGFVSHDWPYMSGEGRPDPSPLGKLALFRIIRFSARDHADLRIGFVLHNGPSAYRCHCANAATRQSRLAELALLCTASRVASCVSPGVPPAPQDACFTRHDRTLQDSGSPFPIQLCQYHTDITIMCQVKSVHREDYCWFCPTC